MLVSHDCSDKLPQTQWLKKPTNLEFMPSWLAVRKKNAKGRFSEEMIMRENWNVENSGRTTKMVNIWLKRFKKFLYYYY